MNILIHLKITNLKRSHILWGKHVGDNSIRCIKVTLRGLLHIHSFITNKAGNSKKFQGEKIDFQTFVLADLIINLFI